jgi:hypothetical protein
MRRLITPDGAEGHLAHSFRHVYFQIWQSSMYVVMLGAFNTRPPARVPNRVVAKGAPFLHRY